MPFDPPRLILVGDPLPWWRIFERRRARNWSRRHDGRRCPHPTPIYGGARIVYGLRCAVCFRPCRFVESRAERTVPVAE